MSSYVLIHGARHGGWCWKRVLPPLRQAGHDVHAITLTGVGERAHLLDAGIRLNTHLHDVINLINAEELQELVLVGHSYAGMVITGVADRLQRENREVIRHLVYVDAVTPHPGESWSSQHPAEVVSERVKAASERGGIAILSPDAEVFGLEGEDRAWVTRRQTPQPLGVYQDTLMFDPERIAHIPRTFIDCTSPALATINVMRQRVRQEPGWRVVELATGHDPMISEPEKLAEILLDVNEPRY